MNNKSIYLPGLNGIRAIAAIGVLFSHINLALPDFGVLNYSLFGFGNTGSHKSWQLGAYGVTIFFVLSGFLITYLLLKEIKKFQRINKKDFYIRRILRIWPLYFFYLIVSLIILSIFNEKLDLIDVYLYIFVAANIPFLLGTAIHLVGHLWSVAVEEQFYLFWPLLFTKRGINKKLLIVLIAGIFSFKIFLFVFYRGSLLYDLFFINRFECMMIGGLVAVLFVEENKVIKIMNHAVSQYLAWGSILILVFNQFPLPAVLGHFFYSLVTACIIVGQISATKKVINLENFWLNYLGLLSFGIYVYHPLVIYILQKISINNWFRNEITLVVVIYVSVIGLTIIMAQLSYNYLEKWFIQFKVKYAKIKSTNVVESQ